MDSKSFVDFARDFLFQNKPVETTDEALQMELIGPLEVQKDPKGIFRSFVITLQDYNSRPRIINFFKNENSLTNLLFDFDVEKILNAYTKDSLFQAFQNNFPIKNGESKRNSWRAYAASIISGAKFFSRFPNKGDFDCFISCFGLNEYSAEALPLVLQIEINGIGFALACSFIKDLGYTAYAKPDVHTKEVFSSLGFCNFEDLDCYKCMVKTAKEAGITPFTLDKIIWIICSGYYPKKQIKGMKPEFIKAAKVHFGI